MAGFLPPGITVVAATALDLLSPILFSRRSIGGFVANATLEEDHHDEIEISDHPVEQGGNITDNAYKRPASVTITVGYTNSSLAAFGNPFYVQQVYAAFRDLQESLEPFEISTGKRIYDDMLIKRLSTKTDEKTANSMILIVECREIQIVSTETVSRGTGPASAMKDPANNAGVSNLGSVSAKPYTGPNLGPLQGVTS
jgi:hypothetical protein